MPKTSTDKTLPLFHYSLSILLSSSFSHISCHLHSFSALFSFHILISSTLLFFSFSSSLFFLFLPFFVLSSPYLPLFSLLFCFICQLCQCFLQFQYLFTVFYYYIHHSNCFSFFSIFPNCLLPIQLTLIYHSLVHHCHVI